MGMSTDVIIGHFLKSETDISSIVHSDKLVDTVVELGENLYFSNHGNTVFHWTSGEAYDKVVEINPDVIEDKRVAFLEEIKPITQVLDMLRIRWSLEFGAKTFYH